MTEEELQKLLQLETKIHRKLWDLNDLTQELSDSVERQDDVSIRLFLSLRQTALLELQELTASIDLLSLELSPAGEKMLRGLLSGAAAETAAEVPVAERIAANQRLFQKLAALDEEVNRMLCGERSFYQN